MVASRPTRETMGRRAKARRPVRVFRFRCYCGATLYVTPGRTQCILDVVAGSFADLLVSPLGAARAAGADAQGVIDRQLPFTFAEHVHEVEATVVDEDGASTSDAGDDTDVSAKENANDETPKVSP